jgi:hypothetical protein
MTSTIKIKRMMRMKIFLAKTRKTPMKLLLGVSNAKLIVLFWSLRYVNFEI